MSGLSRVPIRLAAGSGVTFGVDDIACAAATHLGFWADEGLDVLWSPWRGGLAAAQAVLDGQVDIAYGGLGPVFELRSKGAPLRIVVSMARALAQQLVVQAHIRDAAQLRGASWALDGIGALSHHMARLVVAALGISEADIDWQVVGPPPQRIERLLAGTVYASLIRVEEATALTRDPGNSLHRLLGFSELGRLVPVQPHGVLSCLESFEREHPDVLLRLARGMIRASRALHDDYRAFRSVYDSHVTVSIPDSEIEAIWRQEVAHGGFAVNGEMSSPHWDAELSSFASLNPQLRRLTRGEVLAPQFVGEALVSLGMAAGEAGPDW